MHVCILPCASLYLCLLHSLDTHVYIYICAHTYAHTAKRCLDPPCTTLQFAHALHTATSTSAVTPTKNVCAASPAYQILRYTCVLNVRRPMHTHASMPVYNKLRHFHCECAQSFSASVCEVSVQASSIPKYQIRLSSLAVKLCIRSVASSTLVKLQVLSQRSLESTGSLNRTRSCDHCRSFDRLEWVAASTLAVFVFSAVKSSTVMLTD